MTCTVEEAAEMLGIARHTAYQAAARGELPTVRIGRRLLVPLARLNDLLGQREEVTGEEAPELGRLREPSRP
jgi:excisionase family DNA binding protein